jgi:hypothetical protein
VSATSLGNPVPAPREGLVKPARTGREHAAQHRDRLRPTREAWVDLAFAAALVAVALVGYRTGFFGWQWILAAGSGLVLGLLVSHLTVSYRLPAVVALAGVAVVYLVLGGPLAVRDHLIGGVVPSGQTFHDLVDTLVHGWKQFLTTLPPVDSQGPLLALPFLTGLAGGALTYFVARRLGSPYAAVLAPLGLLALCVALGTLQPASLLFQGAGFALLAVGWMVVRAARTRAPLQNGAGRRSRAGIAAALLAVAGAAGFAAGPHLPGTTAEGRSVVRSVVTPPFDVAQYPSPLAGFRKYTEPNPADLFNANLLQVKGVPAGTPLRFATLDHYDGSVWGAANRAQNGTQTPGAAFQQVGTRIAPHGTGSPTTVEISVPEGGYDGVWLPTVGNVTGVEYSGPDSRALTERTWLNIDTSTAIIPAGLGPGDSYTLRTLFTPRPQDEPRSVSLDSGSLTEDQDTGYLDAKVDAWTTGAETSDPWRQLLSVASIMKHDGAYTDGGTANSFERYYLAGHSQGRMIRFVGTTRLAGDDEQCAAAEARVGNRPGAPTRVVVGAIVPEGGAVKGKDVHAWVEVRDTSGSWVPILPDAFIPDRNQKPDQLQTKTQEQKVGARVPPPPGVSPPSVLQGPDQAQNATNLKKPPKKLLDPSLWPWWLRLLVFWVVLPALVLLAVYGAIRGLKAWRRKRHATRGPTTSRVAWAWDDLVQTARSYGHSLPRRSTRLEQAVALGHAAELQPLAAQANSLIFGPGTPSEDATRAFVNEADAKRSDLRSHSDFWRRLRADVDPRPLFAPGPTTPDARAAMRLRVPSLRRATAP